MIEANAPSTSISGHWTPVQRSEWFALINWLVVWIILANSAFSLMYFIGSPPRVSEIFTFGAVGLIVRRQRYLIQVTAFILAMIYSILSFIAGLFNLAIGSLIYSIGFLAELDFAQSTEYLVGSAAVVVLVCISCARLKQPTAFRDIRMTLLAALATVLMVLVDLYFGQGMRGHYNRVATADTPFSSAVEQSGAVPASGVLERNLVVVMVESLGVPVNDGEIRNLLFARYLGGEVRRRFEVSRGSTTYFGSTTSGEIRELCGRWGEYHDLIDDFDGSCLPARLAAQGTVTSAYHSFDGNFFDRTLWYPNIGFQNAFFRDDLVENGSEVCGGVFPGACDRDVPDQLAERLKISDSPQFVYWLTVNSHLPVPTQNNLDADNCERISTYLAEEFPMICRQFAIWDSIDKALIGEVVSPDFPPTDILIVGDHMPPYYDRHNRRQFAPDRVPWILLKWRETPENDLLSNRSKEPQYSTE